MLLGILFVYFDSYFQRFFFKYLIILGYLFIFKNKALALASVVQLVGASCTPEGQELNSWSGHVPRLLVCFLVRVYMEVSQLMFLSHIHVSLSLSLNPSHPLPSSPSSLIF